MQNPPVPILRAVLTTSYSRESARRKEHVVRCPPPEIAGWRLTRHAEARAAERGFDDAELLAALERPEVSYTQTNQRQVRRQGRVAVVVAPVTRVVVTVLFRSPAEACASSTTRCTIG